MSARARLRPDRGRSDGRDGRVQRAMSAAVDKQGVDAQGPGCGEATGRAWVFAQCDAGAMGVDYGPQLSTAGRAAVGSNYRTGDPRISAQEIRSDVSTWVGHMVEHSGTRDHPRRGVRRANKRH